MAILLAGVTLPVFGQDVAGNLEQARNAYSKGDLHDSRDALRQALSEVDQQLGKEILAMLPASLGELPYIEDEDQVMSNAGGITGMHLNRSYRDEHRSIDLELIDDSPLLATINRLLTLPSFLGVGDPNQKRIKIHGYKALLERQADDSTGVVSYTIQVPFNRSLFTFRSRGFEGENEVTGMAASLPLEAIVRMTK